MWVAQRGGMQTPTTPAALKRAVSNLDVAEVADDAVRVAKKARTSAAKYSRSSLKDVRAFTSRHPTMTAVVGTGLAVVGVVSLVRWFRR